MFARVSLSSITLSYTYVGMTTLLMYFCYYKSQHGRLDSRIPCFSTDRLSCRKQLTACICRVYSRSYHIAVSNNDDHHRK